MIVSLLSENLLKKLSFTSHAISNKTQLSALTNFLIEAKGGSLKISATDLEIGIITETPASIEEEGRVALPAKILMDLIQTIPHEKIKLSTKKGGLELMGEKIKTLFQTAPTEEIPKLYEEKGREIITIKKESIEKIFNRATFSTSTDTTRPALTGILIKKEEKGDKKVVVATDGYRLSYIETGGIDVEKREKKEEGFSLLVPARVIKEVVLMAKEEGEIKLFVSREKNQILFCQNDTTLIGRLIEAEFPRYEKIVPADFSTKATFSHKEITSAIKACFIFARETANIVKLAIQKEKIVVSANSPSVGENSVIVGAKTIGEENEVAFNARYLLDLFSNVEAQDMTFEMTGPLNPGVFRIVGDSSFFHLIMPIRIQEERS